MKKILFGWTAMWFYQFKNGKILGASVMATLMAVLTFFVAVCYAYDAAKDIPLYTTFFTKVFATLWTIACIGWVVNANFIPKATKLSRDAFPLTQLVRFKDPAYFEHKLDYPNWRKREAELEDLWLNKFGVEYDKSEQPNIGGETIAFWFLAAGSIGGLLGWYVIAPLF